MRWTSTRLAVAFVACFLSLYAIATAVRIHERRYYVFLTDYVRREALLPPAPPGPTHLFFLFADHFEPDWDVDRTREWAKRFRALAAHHVDSRGRPPQHTWFFPGEQIDPRILSILQQMVADDLGEVELHYHHSYDDATMLGNGLRSAIAEFQAYGFLKTITGKTAFAFVHGNEGLDNADGEYCGVNDELRVLRAFGCFADFTFPALYHDAQPPVVNRIYAARDDDQPKSYRTAYPLIDLKRGRADLAIFEGPISIGLTWNARRLFVDVDDANVHAAVPVTPSRIRRWINARVHVPERPDWVFVKVFAHSISTPEDEEEALGPNFDAALRELELNYNDGNRYVLHYVTAREAYNLAIAAAMGAKGPPEEYFDSEIAPYVADAARWNRDSAEEGSARGARSLARLHSSSVSPQ
jgi:hypothetical protein